MFNPRKLKTELIMLQLEGLSTEEIAEQMTNKIIEHSNVDAQEIIRKDKKIKELEIELNHLKRLNNELLDKLNEIHNSNDGSTIYKIKRNEDSKDYLTRIIKDLRKNNLDKAELEVDIKILTKWLALDMTFNNLFDNLDKIDRNKI